MNERAIVVFATIVVPGVILLGLAALAILLVG